MQTKINEIVKKIRGREVSVGRERSCYVIPKAFVHSGMMDERPYICIQNENNLDATVGEGMIFTFIDNIIDVEKMVAQGNVEYIVKTLDGDVSCISFVERNPIKRKLIRMFNH